MSTRYNNDTLSFSIDAERWRRHVSHHFVSSTSFITYLASARRWFCLYQILFQVSDLCPHRFCLPLSITSYFFHVLLSSVSCSFDIDLHTHSVGLFRVRMVVSFTSSCPCGPSNNNNISTHAFTYGPAGIRRQMPSLKQCRSLPAGLIVRNDFIFRHCR